MNRTVTNLSVSALAKKLIAFETDEKIRILQVFQSKDVICFLGYYYLWNGQNTGDETTTTPFPPNARVALNVTL